MRLGLQTKFFLSFLLISLTVVIALITVTHIIAFTNFRRIADQIGKAKIDALVVRLQEEYRIHNGWSHVDRNPHYLRDLIERQTPPLPFDPPPAPLMLPPRVPVFVHSMVETLAFGNGGTGEDAASGHNTTPKHFQPPHVYLAGLLTLFDDQYQPIVGAAGSTDGLALKRIRVDGTTVGWLGMQKPEPNRFAIFFGIVLEQSIALLIVGSLVLVIAALASFVLSRHLLAPVKKLTHGARAFAHRDFKTRIDVTSRDELGNLAGDFNAMAETLEKYEEMRKQWLSDISHELRTPLSVLRGEVEALQDGIRQTNRETLSSLHAEVIHISRIVDDLHELSLADSGALHLKMEPVFPLDVLKEQFSLFQKNFAEQRITVTENIDHDRPRFLGDRDRLAQLFANLFKNTLRHTDSPGRLNVWHVQEAHQLLLYFEDSEPGVPEESLDKVFDRLYRVDSSRNRSKGGTGLGLAICKNIVESHGGTIIAAPSSLGGLKIEIVFPLDYP